MPATDFDVTSIITKCGLEQITTRFMELTGEPASHDCLRYMWDRANTQVAHRDYGPVQVGLGDWETTSGRAERIEFPRDFFIL